MNCKCDVCGYNNQEQIQHPGGYLICVCCGNIINLGD